MSKIKIKVLHPLLLVRFYNKMSRCRRDPSMKIGMQFILCMLAGQFTKNSSTWFFLASVACPPQLLRGFAHAVRYTHVYLAYI